MNAEEFVKYLAHHKGEAYIGKSETLEVAKKMENKGLLQQIGTKDGRPFYRVTVEGDAFLSYSMKRLKDTKGDKAKKVLSSIGSAVDAYIQAFKRENPAGIEDIKRVASLFGGASESEVLTLPSIAPMELDIPRQESLDYRPKQKALTERSGGKKPKEYIKIDGKLYEKVEDD